jgi:hypothetical protein
LVTAVLLDEKFSSHHFRAATDEKGAYELKGLRLLEHRKYRVRVTYPGFVAGENEDMKVAAGEKTVVDFSLTKGVGVSGKVVMVGTGAPVPGAKLWMKEDIVKTGKDGSFKMQCKPGELPLSIMPLSVGYVTPDKVVRNLTIEKDKDVTDVVFEVNPWTVYSGKVVGPNGKGVKGARVTVGTNKARVVTGGGGKFSVPLVGGIPAEDASIAIAVETDALRGLATVPVPDAKEIKGKILMQPVVAMKGRVIDEAGAPMPAISVKANMAVPEGSGTMLRKDAEAKTDASGCYAFATLIAGQFYRIVAEAEDYAQTQQLTVDMKGGEPKPLNDIVLVKTDKTIEGRVVDEFGNGIAGMQISGYIPNVRNVSAVTDKDGRFRLEKLPGQMCRLWASGGANQYGNGSARGGAKDVEILVRDQSKGISSEDMKKDRVFEGDAPGLQVARWVQQGPVTVKESAGKVLVIAFLDGVEECREVIDAMNRISEDYKQAGVTVLAIVSAKTEEKDVKGMIARLKGSPVAIDNGGNEKFKGATFESYRVRRAPAVYIIDRQGKVACQDVAFTALDGALKRALGLPLDAPPPGKKKDGPPPAPPQPGKPAC